MRVERETRGKRNRETRKETRRETRRETEGRQEE